MRVHQNTPVRRTIAPGAIAALLVATLYAPLFHLHTDAGEAPLLHAHFPELEVSEDESVVHMERPHSHAEARPVDLLITTMASAIHFDAALVGSDVMAIPAQPRCGFVSIAAPRAHAPPALQFLTPRAPPA